jgi:hypothetical protein
MPEIFSIFNFECYPMCMFIELYRVFHNVLCDYKHLQQQNQRTYLNGTVHSHRKIEKVFFDN